EPHQLSNHPLLLLSEKHVLAHKARFVELDDPPKSRLERRMLVIDVISVERVLHLRAKRVSSAQTSRHQSVLLALLQHLPPQLLCVFWIAVQLKAIFPRVTSARNDATCARNLCFREAISSNPRKL